MRTILIHATVLAGCALSLEAASPQGWFMAGSKSADYESNVDTQMVYNGKPSASMFSKEPAIDGFGTLMQNFSAEKYLGKRVRFSAFVKSSGVQEWAGLWMRVDGSGKPPKVLAFDNMQNRAVKGDTEWRSYEVVLDVAEGAKGILFGILLAGTGAVWMNSPSFEIVETSVPTTGVKPNAPEGPTNLTFEK